MVNPTIAPQPALAAPRHPAWLTRKTKPEASAAPQVQLEMRRRARSSITAAPPTTNEMTPIAVTALSFLQDYARPLARGARENQMPVQIPPAVFQRAAARSP